MKKKQHPTFNVVESDRKKRVKDRWRRPRGIDSKKRIKMRKMGALPNIGYKNPEKIRGVHPCGKMEVLVANLKQLAHLKGKDVVIKIRACVGRRLRSKMEEQARELGLDVLN